MRQTLFYAGLLLLCHAAAWGQAQRVKTSAPSGIYLERENAVAGNRLFMICNDKLSVTDGTDAGTLLLAQNIAPRDLAVAGSLIVFTADDGIHGREIWASDGTTAGTHMLTDINTSGSSIAADTSCPRILGKLVPAGNQVFFKADDGLHGSELWRTDGTTAGTFMVKDINPYGSGAVANTCYTDKWGASFGGLFYFSASDSTHGQELWATDGSSAGTFMVADLTAGPFGATPVNFHVAGTKMFFSALDTGCFSHLYVSDGSPAGTYKIAANISPTYYATTGNTTFFTDLSPGKLYKIDAQNSVTLFTDTINIVARPADNMYYTPLVAYNNSIFYISHKPLSSAPYQLMRLDAATGITSIVRTSASVPGQPIVAGNKLWFKDINADSTADLYYTDGTAAGTQKIAYPVPNRYKVSNPLIKAYIYYGVAGTLGNEVYYTMLYDSTSNLELYKTSIFPTGIVQNTAVSANEISVFPNPGQSDITIKGDHITGISMYNTTGALLQKERTNEQQQAHVLHIENLPSGIYLLVIDKGAQATGIRFEKQ